MSIFPVHTKETAPEGARDTLDQVEAKYGFLPNLFGKLAESPAAAGAYVALSNFFAGTDFSPAEQQVVLLTTSRLNECAYCMAAHSTAAGMFKVPEDVVSSLREGTPIADAKLEALRRFTGKVVEERGWVAKEDVAAFMEAGYSRAQVLDVLVGVTQKTLSNYVNHIVETPVDDAFAPSAWQKAG